jgi:hypothetical protein
MKRHGPRGFGSVIGFSELNITKHQAQTQSLNNDAGAGGVKGLEALGADRQVRTPFFYAESSNLFFVSYRGLTWSGRRMGWSASRIRGSLW